MSRVIVKNLPKKVTEDKIRETFSQIDTITDIQLKYTSDGKFRQFGFIGFQNEDSAEKAIQTLDKTFLNTSKIIIEKCAMLGDESKPKSWSIYAADSTANKIKNKVDLHEKNSKNIEGGKKKEKNNEATKLLEKYKDDPLFEEFLQVHNPSELKKLHSVKDGSQQEPDKSESDVTKQPSILENREEEVESESEHEKLDKLAEQPISDLEYMKQLKNKGTDTCGESNKTPRKKMEKKVKEKIELFTLKLKDLPYKCTKRDIKDFLKPLSAFSIRIPRNLHGIAYVGFKSEKPFKKCLLKDKSFIKGKQVIVMKYTKGGNNKDELSNTNENSKHYKWKNQEEALKNEEHIAESGRIFIRNLAYTTTEDEIENMFSKFGPLASVDLPVVSGTTNIKGFGVVTYVLPEHAVKAYSELDGTIFHGRMLHLLPGKAKDKQEDNLEDSSNYKKKKAANQKSLANSHYNWNSLFLGHDAVAEVIADTYGTSKEAVIGPEGQGSAAVKLALGEAHIVEQTRNYLKEQGVVLDAFNNAPTKKSKTVILVKNLPSRTEIKEIRVLFEKYAELERIILPPSGITAIVQFLEPSEARKAFNRLAYSKFKNMPLYLEWAPENSLIEIENPGKHSETDNSATNNNLDTNPETEITKNIKNCNETTLKTDIQEKDIIEDEKDPEPDTTLFVKNLNFQTTEESLRKHFDGCGKVYYSTVATKKDSKNPTNKISMGYGFVRFMFKKDADKALKTLQQSVLDGKSLELKRSERILQNDVKSQKKPRKLSKQTGSKILVRNVPFQANKTEIYQLFSTFGEIKACRLPKKMSSDTDSHRGFAFVDFVTESDAKTAFTALSQSTHLYGRRLVLEWASPEEKIDELRKRTADHFASTEKVESKKSVFSVD